MNNKILYICKKLLYEVLIISLFFIPFGLLQIYQFQYRIIEKEFLPGIKGISYLTGETIQLQNGSELSFSINWTDDIVEKRSNIDNSSKFGPFILHVYLDRIQIKAIRGNHDAKDIWPRVLFGNFDIDYNEELLFYRFDESGMTYIEFGSNKSRYIISSLIENNTMRKYILSENDIFPISGMQTFFVIYLTIILFIIYLIVRVCVVIFKWKKKSFH